MNKIIASIFGIGYIKGGGTLAAIVTCPLIWLMWRWNMPWVLLVVTILITILGIYVGDKVEPEWGKDSYRVVIDEVSGMLVTILFIPPSLYLLLGGLVLFRFFDILKPLGIRKMEAFPGGTGVMMDDVLAGAYGNIVLQLVVFFLKIKGIALI